MYDKNSSSSTQPRKDLTSGILARGSQVLFVLVFLGLVLFLSSGTLKWIAAWVYLGISLISILINSVLLLRTSPETVAERGQAKGWRDWDKLISGFWGLLQYLLLPLIAGLDARYHWTSEIGLYWHAVGALGYSAGLAGVSWAMITNTYFSTAARIQSDRGQQVCRTGPYRYIRHPGYAGTMLQSASTAILLGSLWALIPALGAITMMLTRTILEDRMLQNELEGYVEYTQKVKYRLLPGIW